MGALDEQGRRYALVGRRWPVGHAMDPFTWLGLTLDLIGRLCRKAPGIPIQAIAVDGTSGTVLMCAQPSGRPITPVLAYHDARAVSEAQELNLPMPKGRGFWCGRQRSFRLSPLSRERRDYSIRNLPLSLHPFEKEP
ncbi:MAG TPA: hypothetical protein VMV40_10340, partial [Acidiferrobacter sp.]|nr:hypothetical protein [Acidiferrobacter sp.]